MIRNAAKVNSENLRQLCWNRRYQGVAGLARALGKHRTSIHRAIKNPSRFPKTYALITKALL